MEIWKNRNIKEKVISAIQSFIIDLVIFIPKKRLRLKFLLIFGLLTMGTILIISVSKGPGEYFQIKLGRNPTTGKKVDENFRVSLTLEVLEHLI